MLRHLICILSYQRHTLRHKLGRVQIGVIFCAPVFEKLIPGFVRFFLLLLLYHTQGCQCRVRNLIRKFEHKMIPEKRRRVTLGVANTPNSEWYHRFQRNSLQTTSSGAPIRGDRLSQSPDSARGGSDSGLGVQQPEFGDPVTAGHGYSMDNRRNRLRGH